MKNGQKYEIVDCKLCKGTGIATFSKLMGIGTERHVCPTCGGKGFAEL